MPPDFSLFDHSRPLPRGPTRAQAVAAVLVAAAAWLPLVGLTAQAGELRALFSDPGPHARLLVALPLLLLAPMFLSPRMADVARHFTDAGLVAPEHEARYRAELDRLLALRDSRPAHLACLALAVVGAFLTADLVTAEAVAGAHLAWRAGPDGGPSAAGLWLALVARPLHFYVWAAFVWRLSLWWRFLHATSRLNLRLTPGPPDQAAGLGFLAVALRGFQPALFALAASPAGGLASLMLERRPPFQDPTFALATAGVVAAALVAAVVAPLLFFGEPLLKARQRGQLAYAALSERQLRRFEGRWLEPSPAADRDPLDAPDFSAVIDLSSTVATAGRIRVTPFSRTDLLRLMLAAAAPFAPAALIEVPAREILTEAVKLVL